MPICIFESCNKRYILPFKLQNKFYTRNVVEYSPFTCLSTECSHMMFKGFHIEFHAKLLGNNSLTLFNVLLGSSYLTLCSS